MWPADKRFMTPSAFTAHIAKLDFTSWRPIGIVWHNTASPTLKRWHEFSRSHWMHGLESYYKGLGWSGGPHLFCDDGADGIGLFNPLNKRGTHSPSFNAQYIGIEHVGNYASEDDDSGPGFKVKMNGIAATAIICARLGIPADRAHIKLHKDDPRTTHDCPGKDMAQDVLKSIAIVNEYMGTAGDHPPDWSDAIEPKPSAIRHGTTKVADLNMREQSSASSKVIVPLTKGRPVDIISEAKNGETLWYYVGLPDKPTLKGWVAARYVDLN